jgi:hypothetical protein
MPSSNLACASLTPCVSSSETTGSDMCHELLPTRHRRHDLTSSNLTFVQTLSKGSGPVNETARVESRTRSAAPTMSTKL